MSKIGNEWSIENEFLTGVDMISITIVGIMISLICVLILALEKPSYLGRELLLFAIGSMVCEIGYYLKFRSVNQAQALTCVQFEYLGIVVMTGMIWMFVTRCCKVHIPRWVNWTIAIFSIGVLVCIGISDRLSVFYRSVEFSRQDGVAELHVTGGVLFYVYAAYTAVIYTALLVITIWYHVTSRTRDSFGILMMGLLYPGLGILSTLYLCGLTGGVEITPFTAVGTLLYHLVIVYRFRLFDSMQMAKDNIIQGIQEAFLIVDTGERLLYANPYAKHLLPDIRRKDRQSEIINELMKMDKENLMIENRWYQIYTSPFHDRKQVKGHLIWLFDKTDEYAGTQKLIELKEQAEQANKTKSEFLKNISHEFRTPLNAIMGTAEMLIQQNVNQTVTESAGNIKQSGQTLLLMIDDILGYTGIEAGTNDKTQCAYNLKKVIRDVVEMNRVRLGNKPVELQVNQQETVPTVVWGNETAVRQILMNLMGNAVKYTDRGTIRLELEWTREENDAILVFSIADTGRGIREESRAHLFEPFQRADMEENGSVEGTGLGLAICKHLVEQLGGTIGYISEYAVGSTFFFTVRQGIVDVTPMGQYGMQEENGAEQVSLEAPDARVMVVDDNSTNLRVAKGLFRCFGIDASVADGGRECLAKVGSSHYDLIFMDYMMPDMDGIETLHRIRTMDGGCFANLPVVAFTANATSGMREMFIEQGFADFIPKPLGIKSLERILRTYLPDRLIREKEKTEPSAVTFGIEAIPGIDLQHALGFYGGNTQQLLHMMQFFYEDGYGQMKRMNRCMDEKDAKAYLYEVHALKGLARGIGAENLADRAERLELACKAGTTDRIEEENAALVSLYRTLLTALEPVLRQHGLVGEAAEPGDGMEPHGRSALTAEEWKTYLEQLREHLEMLEQNPSRNILATLRQYSLEPSLSGKLDEIAAETDAFEFERAEAIVRDLLASC